MPDPCRLIDAVRYPLHDLDSPAGRALVATCRADLRSEGAAVLHGLLTDAARAEIVAEAQAGVPQAFFCDNSHNVYLSADDDRLDPLDPRRRRLHTVVGSIAYDLLSPHSPLRALYTWDPLLDFVRAVLDVPELHRLADPLGALSINVFRPGDRHEWHFDESEFTTTLMLQEADDGGFFEYLPHLRQPDGSELGRIAEVLDGDERGIQRLRFAPGDLSIFAGRRALHRVTEVLGATTRLVAVLTFNGRPNVTNSDEVRRMFWGRTA